ncbi:PepSY domain-containing protein [Pacificimonas sp. WHA3]|uniref:PepSY domain-containing protein n=2 Tax=Pacificimonas pallii TaxID=2827236 RepID=A0ABS6SH64_9SPHN|nr:PepSY domain-containing protein [Pacificimonas pallii]
MSALAAATIAAPAMATGKVTCDVPESEWQPREALEAQLTAEGWTVRKSKVDGGCYEVYAKDEEGRKIEAYFDPATFEKLYVAQRGKVLFEKK